MEPLAFSPEDTSAFKPEATQSFVLMETGERFPGTAVTKGVVGKRLAFTSDGTVLFFLSGLEFDAVSSFSLPGENDNKFEDCRKLSGGFPRKVRTDQLGMMQIKAEEGVTPTVTGFRDGANEKVFMAFPLNVLGLYNAHLLTVEKRLKGEEVRDDSSGPQPIEPPTLDRIKLSLTGMLRDLSPKKKDLGSKKPVTQVTKPLEVTGFGDSGREDDTIEKKYGKARRDGRRLSEHDNLSSDPQRPIKRPSQAKHIGNSSSGEVETEGPMGTFDRSWGSWGSIYDAAIYISLTQFWEPGDLPSLSSVFTVLTRLFRIQHWERKQNSDLSFQNSVSGVWNPADLDGIPTPLIVRCLTSD
ncbi:hypothetical protein STEG23_023703 [Scotinomys teguina]